MRQYDVWIYDEESGCDQPARFSASSAKDAEKKGRQYIRAWNLRRASITKIEEVRT